MFRGTNLDWLCGGTFEVTPGVEIEEYQSGVEENTQVVGSPGPYQGSRYRLEQDTQGVGSPGPCQGPRYRVEQDTQEQGVLDLVVLPINRCRIHREVA